MKTMKSYTGLLLSAMLTATSLIAISCSSDDEPSFKSVRTDHYTIQPAFAYGQRLIGGSGGDYSIYNSWGTSGSTFLVYVSQNGKITDLGQGKEYFQNRHSKVYSC